MWLRIGCTLILLVGVLAELRPDPIPRMYDDSNILDNTLYGLGVGGNARIQPRIVALENRITRWIMAAERLINRRLLIVERQVSYRARRNGVRYVDDTVSFTSRIAARYIQEVNSIVNRTLRRVRIASQNLEDRIERETSGSLAAGAVRSAIRRADVIIRSTLRSIRRLVTRTIIRVRRVLYQQLIRVRNARSAARLRRLIQDLIVYVDRNVLDTENGINERAYDAYGRVNHEAKPIPALLNSLLPLNV